MDCVPRGKITLFQSYVEQFLKDFVEKGFQTKEPFTYYGTTKTKKGFKQELKLTIYHTNDDTIIGLLWPLFAQMRGNSVLGEPWAMGNPLNGAQIEN